MKMKVLSLVLAVACFTVFLVVPDGLAEPIKVAVILPSSISDMAWSQSMYDSLVLVQKKMGKDNFQFVYSENMFVIADAAVAIRDYATKGYDLVIALGAQYPASILEVAPDFPEISFLLEGVSEKYAETVEGLSNVFGYESMDEEPGYVMGVVAAKITNSGTIGMIVPIKTGGIRRHVEGFEAGVKATKPDAKVLINWTGSFSNLALASEAAQTQINSGADVLTGFSQMQIGAIGVAEQRGVFYLATQCSEQMTLAPEVMTFGAYNNWSVILDEIIKLLKQGVKGGQSFPLNLANDGFKFQVNQKVFEKAIYGDVIEDIISGKIKLKK